MGFDLDKCLERAKEGLKLKELEIKLLCMKIKEIFVNENNVKRIRAPVTLVGDVHGQFYDVQEIFRVGGDPPYTNYLWLGDYVDRGYYSVEVITLLFLLKLKYPERMTLIRGNHETRSVTQNYGFQVECIQKYGDSSKIWEYYTDSFDFLPLGCIIDTSIFCVHGGLSPNIETIQEVSMLDRFQEIPREGPYTDLMWSDPSSDKDHTGFMLSERGAGYLFGGDVVEKFLHVNGLIHLARAHQLCTDGFQVLFDDKLSTVWSAPNYMYRFKNKASILEIDEHGNRFFNIFMESPDNIKKDVGGTGGIQGIQNQSANNYFY
ncbi:hypothetical protein ABPG72_002858 [Tetrahymena utriculariae]